MHIKQTEKFASRLKELRPSATFAVTSQAVANNVNALDQFVASLGFRGLDSRWLEIDREKATTLLRRVLEKDLAYGGAEMESDDATAVAQEFIGMARNAKYFTNGQFSDTGWSGDKVASGTFETGVVWVSDDHLGILWVEDED